jgi:hypothetical protein
LDHYDVLIATPGATLEASYVSSLVETIRECNKRGITFKWLNAYSSLVHHARELTATGNLRNQLDPSHKGPMEDSVTYNKIFWIDSDIEWTPEQFFKLYDSECAVISGVYLLADGITTSAHGWGIPGGIPVSEILEKDKPFHVQSTGFGFVAVKQGVFEVLKRPWFAMALQAIELPNGSIIEDSLGEDISWCMKAHDAGIPIFLDPTVKVTHIKKEKLKF